MRFLEITRLLEAEALVEVPDYNPEIENVCASDLLSDILATAKENFIILTGLTTPQVIRTAEVVGAFGIVLVRGKYPNQEIIGLARAHEIPLYVTKLPMFEACVRLKGTLKGCSHARPSAL